jgi:methyltransferase
MGEGALLVGFIAVQRLAELALAQVHTRRLMAEGGVEFGRSHYWAIVVLHASWLAALMLFGHERPVDRWWLAAFVVLQGARVWTIASLGRRWTTRIVVIPCEPRVSHGPYRLTRHPNYWIVAAEFAVVPLALGLPVLGAAFFVLNALALSVRVKAEEAALAWADASARSAGGSAPAKVLTGKSAE